jgi:hypothetical protein
MIKFNQYIILEGVFMDLILDSLAVAAFIILYIFIIKFWMIIAAFIGQILGFSKFINFIISKFKIIFKL